MTEENAMKQPEKEEEMVMETQDDNTEIEKLDHDIFSPFDLTEKKISEVELQMLCPECKNVMNKNEGIQVYACPQCHAWIPIVETKAQQIQALKAKLEALESVK